MRPDLLFGVKGVEGIGVELFDRDAKVSRQLGVEGGFEEQLKVPHVGVLSVQVDLDPKVPRHTVHPVDHWDDLGDHKVFSLTPFYSAGFSQSRITVQIKVHCTKVF